jgi:outer membrane lipoprotein SlyB
METLRKIRVHPMAVGLAAALIAFASAEIAAAPPPMSAQAAPGCHNCGVVASVSAYKQKPKRSVVGMVGGGVLGAVVGSEIGNGSTLATVGGAAGGAYLGNKVGQKMQSSTRYKVVLRMDSGGTRSVTYAQRPNVAVGSHVRLENGRLMPA